jgi:hypothetical protein
MEKINEMIKEVPNTFKPGTTKTTRDTKNSLQGIYDRYKINATAKASDLPLYGVNFRDTTVKNNGEVNKHILLFN